ncbi:hypothetical protein D3C87_1563070 [compost metagenome]
MQGSRCPVHIEAGLELQRLHGTGQQSLTSYRLTGEVGDAVRQADADVQADSTVLRTVFQPASTIESGPASQQNLESRRGRYIESLVTEQSHRSASGLQPALPSALRLQSDFVTTRRDIDLERVLNIKDKIQCQIRIVGHHHVAHVKVTARPDAISQVAGVEP